MGNKLAMKVFTLALMLASGGAHAQATPMGLWKVLVDEAKQPLSPVRIGDAGGVPSGRTRGATSAPTSARSKRCRA